MHYRSGSSNGFLLETRMECFVLLGMPGKESKVRRGERIEF